MIATVAHLWKRWRQTEGAKAAVMLFALVFLYPIIAGGSLEKIWLGYLTTLLLSAPIPSRMFVNYAHQIPAGQRHEFYYIPKGEQVCPSLQPHGISKGEQVCLLLQPLCCGWFLAASLCRRSAKMSALTSQQKCHIHGMENMTLTQKEQARLQVLNGLLAEQMTLDQAATLMGVTTRHARRILSAYREEGAAAVAHGHRGRKPPNATPDAVVADVVRLARTKYAGANHTHLSELLSEREGIDMGRTTLRRILVNAGLSSPRRRRPPKHRVRRQRMPRQGMLIQMDGSHHRWLGDQAAPFALLIAVDDATGTVVDALFCEQEDAHSYFVLIQGLVQHLGVPVALYTDRHAVFRHTPGSGLPGMPTQFSRAMEELEIQMIFARSPQAKGRVERTAGTFQDRLITELRLVNANTIGAANSVLEQFLPRFNRRFQVPPQHPEPAFRPLDPELCLEQILCFKHRRKVAKDNTVRFQLHTLQLLPGPERPS